ncbi:protein sel-1 1 [Diplogelasinospora grovesii]|uniref:Protein sel-1 1 n=1 Tax=Diplogelasinospora grovesii TaxID=303347 RepID=A0AAN6NKT8_9PEZI|nr:protein sel-1 1 [Diplogelasinospora grovesii]
MRRYLVSFFLLLQALAFSCAIAHAAQHVLDTDQAKDAKGDTFRAEVAAAQGNGHPVREPGADLVETALADLRRIYQPFHYRIPKKHGILGAIVELALKAMPTIRLSAPPAADSSKSSISGPLLQAVKLLEESSRKNNSDALYILAEMNFYGNYSHPKNFKAAFDYYQKLALLNGNSSAQYMLGLMYSTGVGNAVPRDQARALLYYTFAADQGHTRAEMAVAYRHHAGIGTPKSCETVAKHYKRVADKAIAWYRSGPPGGMSWIAESSRIADDVGGVYGEGASASSAGQNAVKAHPNSDAYASIEDIIEYLDLMSQKGDFKASFNLGRIYYEGQKGLERDVDLARKYFKAVTQRFWKKGRIVDNYKPGLDKTACKAAGFIGRMYLRGEGSPQDFDRAKYWFERGLSHSDAQSQYGLGLMFLNGYGVQKDVGRATEFFKAAADQDYAPAQVQLGSLYLDQGHADDLAAANHYFELAARYGNIEAYYYMADMNYLGVGREKSCNTAVSYYKNVAERAEPLVSSWAEANLAYEDGDTELAFLEYLGAAEQGYEKAQNNVAYMLDPEQSCLPIPQWLYPRAQKPELLQNPSLALIYWTRSARQGNIDSLVKMGDYYLHGVGTDADVDKAVQCYTGASEYHQSAQALYNLGWMHENGVGLNQDYHLAKRYYDSALETNEEAYLPVSLSLLKLRAKSAWNTFTNGRINSIQDEPVKKKDWSLSEWINNFIQDDSLYYDDMYDGLYDDTGMPGGDAGLVDDLDDGIFESVAIVCVAALLVFLVMYRQQRQQAARRREEEAQRQQWQQQNAQHQQPHAPAAGNQNPQPQGQGGNGGFFPNPGDPNFANWLAGGVGH